MRFSAEQLPLPLNVLRGEWRPQQTDDDEGIRVGLHGAEDKMQVPTGDGFAVHLGQMRKGFVAVTTTVVEPGGVHFPIVNDVLVGMTAGLEPIAEHVFGAL